MLPSAQCGPPVRGCYARVQCRFIIGVMIWPRCAVIFARSIADRRQSSCAHQAAGTASPAALSVGSARSIRITHGPSERRQGATFHEGATGESRGAADIAPRHASARDGPRFLPRAASFASWRSRRCKGGRKFIRL
jgi:hypothetical protein